MTEYTDKQGRIILKKVKESGSNYLYTYYVYDDFGNLRVVIPPKAAKLLNVQGGSSVTLSKTSAIAKDLCFFYDYDVRHRMIEKQLPGADPVYFVYDKRDRPVLTQDGVQRKKTTPEWTATKYDALNRPVMTGIFKSGKTRASLQADADASNDYAEERVNSTVGYTLNTSFPTLAAADLLTVTYYDDYDFTAYAGWDAEAHSFDFSGDRLDQAKGQITGNKTRVLGQDLWLNSVSYYDSYYRVVKSITENHLGGLDITTNSYDFRGNLLASERVHSLPGKSDLTITQNYSYDHAQRLLQVTHAINGNTPVVLTQHQYNVLGELIDKKLHSSDGGSNFMQSIDYRYNIRGWLTHINNSELISDGGTTNDDSNDLFGMQLLYNENLSGLPSSVSYEVSPASFPSYTSLGSQTKDVVEQMIREADEIIRAQELHRMGSTSQLPEEDQDKSQDWFLSLKLPEAPDEGSLTAGPGGILPLEEESPVAMKGFTAENNIDSLVVLYRINAGGSVITATPDWITDTNIDPSPYSNSGHTSSTSATITLGASVPAGTPASLFQTERYWKAGTPALSWAFPILSGTAVEVRLFLAETFWSTQDVGKRIFDIVIDGTVVESNLDIYAQAGGGYIGIMKAYFLTSDGTVDISFNRIIENPAVKAIEIYGEEGANIINTAPVVVSPIADITLEANQAPFNIELSNVFSDAEDAFANLTLTASSSNTALVTTSISGNQLTLTLAADATGSANVTVRATDTGSAFIEDIFNVTVNESSPGGNNSLWLEAECATVLGNNWVTGANTEASNETYITIKDGLNSTGVAPTGNQDIATFNFNISQAGNYMLYARVQSVSGGDNSFWLRINGGTWSIWSTTIANSFTWNNYSSAGIALSEGVNTIEFAYREDSTHLDKLLLTNTSVEPTGLGAAASNCNFPSAPSNLSLIATTETTISFSWNDNSSNETGFVIQRRTETTGYTAIDTVNANITSYVDVDLTSGTTYYYRVKAINVMGSSAYSNELSAVASGMGAEGHIYLEAECAAGVGSNWQIKEDTTASNGSYVEIQPGLNSLDEPPAGTDNMVRFEVNLSASSNYYIQARILAFSGDDDSFWVRVNGGSWIKWWHDPIIIRGDSFKWNLLPDSPFIFPAGINTIEFAYREDGTKLDKILLSTTAMAPTGQGGVANNCGIPEAPSNLQITATTESSISLLWNDNSNNERNFILERRTSTGSFAEIAILNAGTTTFVDENLPVAATYFYRIKASNASGSSAYSNEVSASTSSLWLEAECAQAVGEKWLVQEDSTASNGKYVVPGPGANSNTTAPGLPEDIVRFEVNLGVSSNFYVFARIQAPTTADDSYWVRINGGSWIQWTSGITRGTTFNWNQLPGSPFAFSAGVNTIEFAYREDGTKLDKLYLAATATAPADAGDTGINCNPPAAPVNLSVAASTESSISLSWSDQSNNEQNFVIERRSATGSFAEAGTVSAGTISFVDINLPAATTYFYRVKAINTTASSAYSNEVAATTDTAGSTPVIYLEAECAQGIGASWQWIEDSTASAGKYLTVQSGFNSMTAPPDLDGILRFEVVPAIGSNYYIFARIKAASGEDDSFWVRINGGTWFQWSQGIIRGSSFNWNLMPGGPYAFTTAVNTIEFGYREDGAHLDKLYLSTLATAPADMGEAASNCGDANAPAAPANLVAFATASNTAELSWQDVSGETGYRLERQTGAGSFVEIARLGVDDTAYIDNTLQPLTTYTYRVQAINGAAASAYSNAVTITTPEVSLVAPSSLYAETVSASSIKLRWVDEVMGETGFVIERSSSATGPFTVIHTTAADESSFTDQGLSSATTYYYRVRGVDTNNNLQGDYSSVAASTTFSTTTPTAAIGSDYKKQYSGNIAAIKWKTKGWNTPKEELYVFDYDLVNRLKRSQYAEKSLSSWSVARGHFNVEGISYDENGNIEKLTRFTGNRASHAIDELTYEYGSTNQLRSVTDDSGSKDGFADGASKSVEYAYDENGNLILDENKHITSIRYNLLNLPEEIIFNQEGKEGVIRYLYDAAGTKLQKTVVDTSGVVRVRDYVSGIEYQQEDEQQQLDFIQHSEGRARLDEYGYTIYEYDLKDHLGNVRLSFSSETTTDWYTATMESEMAQEEEEEQGFVNLSAPIRHQDQARNTTPGSAAITNPNEVAWLNPASVMNGAVVGPAKSLAVKGGDKVTLSVQASYQVQIGFVKHLILGKAKHIVWKVLSVKNHTGHHGNGCPTRICAAQDGSSLDYA